jgi:integrase
MKIVQPIRDKNKIDEVGTILKRDFSWRDSFLFEFGINTGLRISDILPLRVKDVLGKDHLVLTEQKSKRVAKDDKPAKAGKQRRFRINYELRETINEYTAGMKPDDYLFSSSRTGKPIGRIQAYRILNAAAEQAGLSEVGTHTLRKTFGYHFYNQYKDVARLQEIFNHSSPSVTLRYIGANQDELDKMIDDFHLGG